MEIEPNSAVTLGDCRQVLTTFPENFFSSCITDPPYNYEFVGHKWDHEEIERRLTRVKDSSTLVRNIPYGSGLAGGVRNARWYERVTDNINKYRQWCQEWARQAYRVCKPGAFVAVFNSTRTIAHVQVAMEEVGFYARDILVFRRQSGIPKGLNLSAQLQKLGREDFEQWNGWHSALRGEWEAIVLVQKPLINNYLQTFDAFGTGLLHAINEDGSFQSNILEGFSRDEQHDFNIHCTVKPLPLMEKLVELLVPPGPEHIVLDPFAGSGTTLLAAQRRGRGFLGIEVVPQYVDIALRRLSEDRQVSGGIHTPRLFP